MTSFIISHNDRLKNLTQGSYPKIKPDKPLIKCKRVNFNPEVITEENYILYNDRLSLNQ